MRALSVGLGWIVPPVVACWAGTPAPPVDFSAAAEDSIRGVVRSESERMLQVMRGRDSDSVLAFYGRHTAYVGNGEIGNWDAIVAGAKPRYATYTKVECRWDEGFRVDIRAPGSAVVTAMLRCAKADTSGRSWAENTARTEVLAVEGGRWRIVAVPESTKPGDELK